MASTPPPIPGYWYRCLVTRVVDGDTIVTTVNLGLGVVLSAHTWRLYGIDAPELVGPLRQPARDSRDALERLIGHRYVAVRTWQDAEDKYGRHLAVVLAHHDHDPVIVNQWMIDNGYARRYHLRRWFGRQPIPTVADLGTDIPTWARPPKLANLATPD